MVVVSGLFFGGAGVVVASPILTPTQNDDVVCTSVAANVCNLNTLTQVNTLSNANRQEANSGGVEVAPS
jgi:hypothetical protein